MRVEDFIQSGDILLYRPKGIFGWAIFLKTWHKVGHCEVYIGNGESVASRDGQGVGRYPLRTSELFKVCRPNQPFDLGEALRWFQQLPETPYGWLDLLAFVGVPYDATGTICSTFAADFLRAGGCNPFHSEPSRLIAPFQFDVSPFFDDYEVTDGVVDAVTAMAAVAPRGSRDDR